MIEVGFSRSNAVGSRLIRAITKSSVSHCFVILSGDDGLRGKSIVLAEDKGGFGPILLDVFVTGNTLVQTFTPTLDIGPGVDAMLPYLGTPYDYPGLLGDALDIEVERLGWHPRNWLHEPGAMVCSNVLLQMLQRVQYPGTSKLVPTTTRPDQLYGLFLTHQSL